MSDWPDATFGPARLDNRTGITWSLGGGVEPMSTTLSMDRAEAAKLRENIGPHTLVFGDARVQDLYAVGEAGADGVFSGSIVVMDRRVFWRRKWVSRSYNIRRRSGTKRRLDDDGDLAAEVAPVVDDVTYAIWSLKDEKETPWTAADVVRDILDTLEPNNWTGNLDSFPQKSVDNVEFDDDGGSALARALALLPGADVYLDLSGRVHIKNSLDVVVGEQLFLDRTSGAPYIDGSMPELVHQSHLRPTECHVLFNVEQEIRFDYQSLGTRTDADERYMENVLPVPDATITINGKKHVRGTWVTMSSYIAAVNQIGGASRTLDDALIRRFWHSSTVDSLFTGLGLKVADADWAARLGAIRTHYRQTFRLSPRWMSRIYSMRAHRVSNFDEETGTFGPTLSYQGYSVVYSDKGHGSRASDGRYAQNIPNTGPGGVGPTQSLKEATVAPAVVSVVDEHLGIVRIDFRTDYAGQYQEVIHSRLSGIPNSHPRAGGGAAVTMDGSRRGGSGSIISIDENHRVSFVLSCAPASPNNNGRYFREIVQFKEAKKRVPNQAGLDKATGPVWELRVGPQLATARFGWHHGRRKEIERSFGVGISTKDIPDRGKMFDLLTDQREIMDMADVVASSLYVSLADHWEGSKTVHFKPSLLPVGNVQRVAHSLNNGVMSTTLSAPQKIREPDPMARLPASARRLFLREVQP